MAYSSGEVTGFCFECSTVVQVEELRNVGEHTRLLICPKCGGNNTISVLNNVTAMILRRIEAIENALRRPGGAGKT